MDRLTEKLKNGKYCYTHSMFDFANVEKLGQLEDIMEKYEIESIEALEEILKDYDAMAKDIVEMGLGVKVELKQ